jgi:predicted membrane channel-forming protein YqfA (hemolysin III family)
MKLLFATLCIIASISGSYFALFGNTLTHTLVGTMLILCGTIFVLLLIIKDQRQEIDFWKSMKGFIFVAVMLLLGSCSSIRKTCPSNDPNFFFKQQSIKPYYYKQ